MKRIRSGSTRSTSVGFSLVEVLVALLVLSVGLLGLAGLQMRGLQANQMSYLRSQATQLAYDISDRMRANLAGVTAGSYNSGAAATDAALCETAECTSANMAQYDLKQWNDALAAQLPEGTGVVCLDDTPEDGSSASPACGGSGSGLYAIKVFWTERSESTDDRNRVVTQESRFVTSFRP